MRAVPLRQVALGAMALAIWLSLYSGGLLLETIDQRAALSPRTIEKQLGEAGKNIVAEVKGQKQSAVLSFGYATLWFTPTNLAFLTLTAALLGGCVSNLIFSSLEDHERRAVPARRIAFLAENPFAAMIRGFVVYLCVIAGLYIAMDDPFKEPSPGQYTRLAGTLSLIAFVVGYDPSRIEDWLRLAPRPSRIRAEVETETRTDGQATQVVRTAIEASPAGLDRLKSDTGRLEELASPAGTALPDSQETSRTESKRLRHKSPR